MNLTEKNYLVRLGKNIREVRNSIGLSQESAAFEAGIDRSYFGGIERGERNVSVLTLIKLAKCLKCDLPRLTNKIP